MQIIKIIFQIALLTSIYIIGNGIQHLFHLALPGSVIGMLLLFGLLSANIIKAPWVHDGSNVMIKHLTFFFIPATVGVLDYFHIFSGRGSLLILIVLFSTLLVLASSGLVSQWLLRRRDVQDD